MKEQAQALLPSLCSRENPMSEPFGKMMEVLLLVLPLGGAVMLRFFGGQELFSRQVRRIALGGIFLVLSVLVFLTKTHSGGLPGMSLTGVLLLLAVWFPVALLVEIEKEQGQTSGVLSFLLLFFSTGFVLSPFPSLVLLFWGGVLGTTYLLFRMFYGSRPTGNLPFALPALLSCALFSMTFFPSSRSFASLAFLLFLPFFPFQRWMSFTPRTGSATVWTAVRLVLFILSAWGIRRWAPLPFSGEDSAFLVFLCLSGLAQIQGALLALGEPVARKRIAAAIFSQMALLTPIVLMEFPRHAGRSMVLVLSLLFPALALSRLTDHLERETRRQNLSDMGGLFREMPRADRLFFFFVLMISAMPGSGLFSGVLASERGTVGPVFWGWVGMAIAGVVLVQWALWQAWEQIFLGRPKEGALPMSDITSGSAGLMGVSFLPLLILAIWPEILDRLLSSPGAGK